MVHFPSISSIVIELLLLSVAVMSHTRMYSFHNGTTGGARAAPRSRAQHHSTKRHTGHGENLLKNPEGPVYLLSLDGGGVRGISEAVILHELMSRIQKKLNLSELPKPCDYFNLIGGTSTGGLIAIMLGRMRMSTREVLREYKSIAKKIFGLRNMRLDLSFGNAKLEQCVKSAAAGHVDEHDGRMISTKDAGDKGLCFVVSIRKAKGGDINTPTLFRSYNGTGNKGTGGSPDCEIWEAARATTAAPRYFSPAQIMVNGKVQYFTDGALRWNNPTSLVLDEAESHFGRHRTLGCLVSLGTGLRESPLKEQARGMFWKSWSVREMLGVASLVTEAEGVHTTIDERFEGHMDSYFRFTVPYVEGKTRIKIDEYKRMMTLCQDTEEYLKQKEISDELNRLVDVLTNNRATNLTLQGTRRANSAETAMEQMTYKLEHRKVTSPHFTGREVILELLLDWFCPREPASYPRRDFWLWGVGGIGKTQIALHFVDMYRKRFHRVWWIDVTTLYRSYEAIAAQVLEFPPQGDQLIPAVINWLESTNEEWLLVVDSYDERDLSSVLPGFSKGNILFTSTRLDLRYFPVKGNSHEVTEMSLSESAELFLRAAQKKPSEDLRARAKPIVEELGSFPLALDQAGAFIRQHNCSFEEYLANLRHNKKDLLLDPQHKGKSTQELAVYSTFDISMNRLRRYAAESEKNSESATAYKSALEILNAFCFYHHQDIPVELIGRAMVNINIKGRWEDILETMDFADDASVQSSESPRRESTETREATENIVLGLCPRTRSLDPEYIFAGIILAIQFSLLKRVPGNPSLFGIPRLVHSWLRDRMNPDTYQRKFRFARAILFHNYNPQASDVHAERFYPSLLLHMEANNSFRVKDVSGAELPLAELERDFNYAMILKRVHLWEKALPVLDQLVQNLTCEVGPYHSYTFSAMLYLGRVYMALGRASDAEAICMKVLDIFPLCEDIKVRQRYNVKTPAEISAVNLARGFLASAKQMADYALQKALEFGKELTRARAAACLVYEYLSMWERAEELAEAVVEVKKGRRLLGTEHPGTMRTVAQLARIRAQRGKTAEAARDLADVAAKFEEYFGPHNLDALTAKSDLAWVYHLQGIDGLERAEGLQRETLNMGRRALGDKHPYTLFMMMRLGHTLGERGQFAEAMRLLKECVDERKALYGVEHVASRGTAAAEELMFDRQNGGNHLVGKLGCSRERFAEMEGERRDAMFPYMFAWT